MISMSKEKMLSYLFDYACLSNLLMQNRDKTVRELFNNYALDNEIYSNNYESDYYDVMRRTYIAYNAFRYYSIMEDFLLNRDDFISNNDLNGLESGFNIIEAPRDLTNKKIIQYIRNAFNHNGEDAERFKISVNGKNYEINLKDTRSQKEIDSGVLPKPVKIKFDINGLMKTINIMSEKRQNTLFLSFDIPEDFDFYSSNLDEELDKIKFIHYYFQKKLDRPVIEKFDQLIDTKNLNEKELLERSDEMNNYAAQINSPIVYNLDSIQKEKLKELILRYRNSKQPNIVESYGEVCGIMFYYLSKVIPVPGFKMIDTEQQIILCEDFLMDVNITYNEIIGRLTRLLNDEPKPDYYDDIDNAIHDYLSSRGKSFNNKFLLNMLDGSFTQLTPVITFIDAFITHYYKESTIEIDGETYNKESVRNSFVHQRWYIDKDNNICLFDADPRNINDYNLEFVGRINIINFYEWASKQFNNQNYIKRNR